MIRRALVAAAIVGILHAHPAAAAEPHAPSVAHKVYPAATQKARDWAWKKLGPREFACLDWIGHRESGWRVRAGNPNGSYGIFQANPARKMRRFGAAYLTDPLVQVRFGIAYADRYGGPCKAWAAWQRQGWW